MKNTKKAFTLVELIVVITILAVLATVAFISLTGHAQDAKNSKVSSDLRTLASAIETKATKDGSLGLSLVNSGAAFTLNTMVGGSNTFKSGGTVLSNANYAIGTVDFAVLGQNGDDFLDASDRPYAVAAVGTRYQLGGEILENDEYVSVIKGNYVSDNGTNVVDGLIGSKANTQIALTNWTGSINALMY